MNEKELQELRNLFISLGKLVQKHGQKYYQIQLDILASIIRCIDSDESAEVKTQFIVDKYKVLFPASGGLSDFYINDDDFQARLMLNEPLDDAKDKIWTIMKQYL